MTNAKKYDIIFKKRLFSDRNTAKPLNFSPILMLLGLFTPKIFDFYISNGHSVRIEITEKGDAVSIFSIFEDYTVFIHGSDFCEGFDAQTAVTEQFSAGLVCLFDDDAGTCHGCARIFDQL